MNTAQVQPSAMPFLASIPPLLPVWLWAAGGVCLLAMIAAAQVPSPEAYRAQIDAWHARRIESLQSETGWLSLVGLYPVAPGTHRIGSAAGNDIVFPEGAPDFVGTLTFRDGIVTARFLAEQRVLSDSGAVTGSVVMKSDAEGNATVLQMGRFVFYLIDRSGQTYIRLKDREAPALKQFAGIERFPVARRWQIEARWERYDPPRTISIPNILGEATEASCPGAAVFTLGGQSCRLEPTGDPEASLFFVFGDATNGHETYGGGRFLYADPPDSAGVIVLDFNRAYNPPCVFSRYATCPLPRAEDVLPVRIEAGEKMYGAQH